MRKAMLLDVGLLHAFLSTPAGDAFPAADALSPHVRGQIAEQVVAQQLRLVPGRGGAEPHLFYWQRTHGRPGEIDFLEVKAGPAGAMKSLHQFMHDKALGRAVRCDSNPPGRMLVDVATTQGQPVSYELVNVPPYLSWNLDLILEA